MRVDGGVKLGVGQTCPQNVYKEEVFFPVLAGNWVERLSWR